MFEDLFRPQRHRQQRDQDFYLKNGSSQGQDLVLTVSCAEFARQLQTQYRAIHDVYKDSSPIRKCPPTRTTIGP